jgi:hypothetical protein
VENREIGQRILENFSKIGIPHSCTTHKGLADPETSTFNFFISNKSLQIVHPFVRFWSAPWWGWRYQLRSIAVKACAGKVRLHSKTLIASLLQLKHPKVTLQKDEDPWMSFSSPL